MLCAGAGVALHAEGAVAASEAARRALVSAGTTAADIALVFAGGRHDHDEYVGVLGAVTRAIPRASVIGCSATGVLSADDELEDGHAVAVLVLAQNDADGRGGARLPRPLFVGGVRADARDAGQRLGHEVLRAVGGDASGVVVALLIDPAELDAVDFLAGFADVAPEAQITGAGVSGGEAGCRVFYDGVARTDACVALVFTRDLHPTIGMTQGCQALSEPLTITAADGNLVLELDGRPSVEALQRALSARIVAASSCASSAGFRRRSCARCAARRSRCSSRARRTSRSTCSWAGTRGRRRRSTARFTSRSPRARTDRRRRRRARCCARA